MAALTADKKRTVQGEPIGSKFLVAASETLYTGAIVFADATGYAEAGTDTSGLVLLGICAEQVDNSSGSDGDLSVICERGHIERLAHSSLTQADMGKNVVLSDDQTVTDAAGATNDVKVGTLVGFVDDSASNDALVLIGVFADANA